MQLLMRYFTVLFTKSLKSNVYFTPRVPLRSAVTIGPVLGRAIGAHNSWALEAKATGVKFNVSLRYKVNPCATW